MIVDEIRSRCAAVARQARHVTINTGPVAAYARSLPALPGPEAGAVLPAAERQRQAAHWLTLDAINFGSGWFPTLRKRSGRSGYFTIAEGLRETFQDRGPWSAAQLAQMDAATVAGVVGQDPAHALMDLFARSLRDLGDHLTHEFDGSFLALVEDGSGSAVTLVQTLAQWDCFADASAYDGITVPFLKRAQIAAADLARAGVATYADLNRLTMFADNLVPHVLRLDGVLRFDDALVDRIDREELIEHGSAEEVEIRACAVHAVELIVVSEPRLTAAGVDQLLWNRGQQPFYKASPRHRSRCTAY